MEFSGYMNYAVLQADANTDNEPFIIALTGNITAARTLARQMACPGYAFPVVAMSDRGIRYVCEQGPDDD
jgi:hypothetical protein